MLLTFKLIDKADRIDTECKAVMDWWEFMQNNLITFDNKVLPFVKMLFGKKKLWTKDFEHFALYLDLTMPPIYAIGLAFIPIGIMFNWPAWIILVSGLIGATSWFWSPAFWFMLVAISLRKKGYKGEIKKISIREALTREVLRDGSD